MKGQKTFIFIAEVPLILSKDNAFPSVRILSKPSGEYDFIDNEIFRIYLFLSRCSAYSKDKSDKQEKTKVDDFPADISPLSFSPIGEMHVTSVSVKLLIFRCL